MANGIGRVWAANAGDDEQKPNGVGSVWIENIEALTPSGGASEEQINELSAAIDYVSANAGDPNALTGYQTDGCSISSTYTLFEAKGPEPYGYDLNVAGGSKLIANNSCSAVFTNGSNFINTNQAILSSDGTRGFVASGNGYGLSVENTKGFYTSANDAYISAAGAGLQAKNNYFDIKADNNGLQISSNIYDTTLKYNSWRSNIKLAGPGDFAFDVSSNRGYSAWIDQYGIYGFSGSNYMGSFGGWNEYSTPPAHHGVDGIGFSATNAKFGIFNDGELKVFNAGRLSASNSCSVLFNNGSRTEITNGHALIVGGNELGTYNGILVSGNGTPYISIYNGGKVKVIDGTELNLSANTHKIGTSLNASGSRFISADGEGVSAWTPDYITVMGAYNQTSSNAAFVIGNGNPSNRNDLFVIDYSGNAKSNDFVANNGAKLSDLTGYVPVSSYNAVTAKVNELEQVLQTYSGQWLIGG